MITMRKQVFAFTTGLTLVIFISLMIVLVSMFYKALKTTYSDGINSDADIIAAVFSEYHDNKTDLRNILQLLANEIGGSIVLIDDSGEETVMDSSGGTRVRVEALQAARRTLQDGVYYSDYSFLRLMETKHVVTGRAIFDIRGRKIAAFAVDYYLASTVDAVRMTLVIVLVFSGIMLLVIVSGGNWFSKRVTVNLNKAAAAAKRISDGDYSARLDIKSNDEFRMLADSFNNLAGRVERNIAEISEQNRVLADVVARQAAFTSNASHELKTPLTGIIGNADVILNYVDNIDDARMLARNIYEDARRLSTMTKNLLDLARMENLEYRKKMTVAETDVSKIMSEAIALCRIKITEKNHRVESILPGNVCIISEPDLVRQVFVNLVDNAAKYSPQGSVIDINVKKVADGAEITVRDNGSGIAGQDLQRIFDRFYRVDKVRSQAIGGTGLGLAITKQIVEILEGRISVQSRLGEGTTFKVFFPDYCRDISDEKN